MSTTEKPTLNQLFVQTASGFAEAIYSPEHTAAPAVNAFGRAVNVYSSGSLARLLGVSATGLRTAGFSADASNQEVLDVLHQFNRMHIPFTLVATGNAMMNLNRFAATGSIIFRVQEAQQLVDQICIAQVISEKALIPVVLIADLVGDTKHIAYPTKKQYQQWFGDNDGRVPDPTPAQTMVQGKMRRRMPGWMQTDNPVLLGAIKNNWDLAVERAAQDLYDRGHIQQIIDDTLKEFALQFGRTYETYQQINLAKARNIAITPCALDLTEALLEDKQINKAKVGFITLNQLSPLPKLNLPQKLDGALVMEPVQDSVAQGWLYRELVAGEFLDGIKKQNAWYVKPPKAEAIKAALLNLLDSNTKKLKYWLDIPVAKSNSDLPKYQVLLQQLQRDYPEAANRSLAADTKAKMVNHALPAAARQVASQGPPYARLSRFFDDTACLYDQPESLIAHPFQSVPVLPVESAVYNYPAYRQEIPVFDPKKVKQVERYPNACPHGALYTGLFTIADLIKSGIAQARSRGEAVSVIVPLSKVWAKHAAAEAIARKGKVTLAREVLEPGFEKALPTAKDQAAAKTEYGHIMMAIADLPIAFTDAFYFEAEKAKPDTGEVFTLGIDPSACTGCGNCVKATTEDALEMKPYSASDDGALITNFNRFEALPDTAPAVTKRLLESDDFDPFAALLLNKQLYRTFSRGGVFWQKGAEGSTVGLITAVAEYVLANNYEEVSKKISVATVGINNVIKKLLSDALPVTNLDSLMEVVTQHSEEKLNMDRIFDEWGKEQQFKAVNKDELQRKLELVEALKQLKWALKDGLNGMGRSRYSVVVDSSLDYLAKHPWNCFNVPVLVAQKGKTADTALGLVEGELRGALDNIRLLRRADLEATGKYNPEQHNAEIAGLSWSDLTDEEKQLVPPVLVLANQDLIGDSGLKALNRLVKKGFPVKVIMLEAATLNPEDALGQITTRANGLWSMVAANVDLIGRASLADAKNLYSLLAEAISSPGSAIVDILTPNAFAFDSLPARWPQLTMLAESSRTFIPFRFNAGAQTMAASLQVGVDNVDADWNTVQLTYTEKGEEKNLDYKLTFADFAYLMNDWKGYFTKLESVGNALEVAAYIDLDEAASKAKVPAIKRVDADGNLLHFAVAPEVITIVRAVRQNFHVLREWAGLFTAFPEKLKAEVDSELRVAYEAEKKKLVAELAAEKKTWEASYLEDMKKQMKERLLQMATQI